MKKIIMISAIFILAGIFQSCKPLPATLSAPFGVEMVLVKAGNFTMGDSIFERSSPVRPVTLTNNFYMGKFEVSNQQYADMLNYALAKGYLDKAALAEGAKKRQARGISKMPEKYQDVWDEDSQIQFIEGKFMPHPGKENYPVVEVTWQGAAFFCNMLSEKEGLTPLYNLDDWSAQVYGKTGYRLPTEAEWEYAAKYDDNRKYPWGNQEPDASFANIRQIAEGPEGKVLSTPSGRYSPRGDSKLGICDLAGNVSEWCNDWYNEFLSDKKEIDPVGPPPSLFIYMPFFKQYQPLRVVRGGCFYADPNFRREFGVPFIIDSVLHEDAINNSFRSFEFRSMSRQVTGFRAVKTISSIKTKAAFSAAQK